MNSWGPPISGFYIFYCKSEFYIDSSLTILDFWVKSYGVKKFGGGLLTVQYLFDLESFLSWINNRSHLLSENFFFTGFILGTLLKLLVSLLLYIIIDSIPSLC